MNSNQSVLNLIHEYFNYLSPIVFSCIGIVGNSLSVFILTRPKLLKESIFRYFLVIEITNLISIILLWVWFIPIVLKWEINNIFCKIMEFIGYTIYTFAAWISTLNALDRLIAFNYAHKFLFRKKLKVQLMAIISILITACLVNTPTIIYFEKSNDSSICSFNDKYAALYTYSEMLILIDIIPFLFMVTSTVSITKRLIEKKKELNQTSSTIKREFKREIQFTKSVLIMDSWLLISYVPFTAVNLTKA